ncbi:MAG: 4-phosphoerythronate dehydrogenase [Gammaproteobacteria bacterium]|nr:4-phosphoerythronate dehydrogenase [Gammaproteobacteria bacterium]
MKIVADQDIFAIEEIFQPLGELVLLPGRSISRRDLVDADALLVRSVLTVGRDLLAGTGVRFAGTATSGVDHVDTRWLREAGIAFAHARGANAPAVVEYCLGALARLTLAGCIDRTTRRVGVIGAGAIGGRLARKLRTLGYEVIVCDPPLAKAAEKSRPNLEPGFEFQSMEAALDCDIVSLHVPLTHAGRHATAGMLDADALARLRPGAVLLQTSRGGVVDEQALLARLSGGPEIHCVVDVWENEPAVNAALAGMASLATPHIAGYSEQAKWAAGLMLARQLAGHFELPQSEPDATGGSPSDLDVRPEWNRDDMGHWRIIDHCMALADLSSQFKRRVAADEPGRSPDLTAKEFDRMRTPRLRRQEFSAIRLRDAEPLTNRQRSWLADAGFTLQPVR